MKLVRCRDPLANLVPFRGFDRLFDEHFTDKFWGPSVLGQLDPPMDIYEKDGEIVLSAELPGMTETDIEVNVEGNTITLKGERKQEDEVTEENYHRIERCYGSFERSFTLPASADTGKIIAEYKNGVLKLRVPRLEEAKPKKIPVKIV